MKRNITVTSPNSFNDHKVTEVAIVEAGAAMHHATSAQVPNAGI